MSLILLWCVLLWLRGSQKRFNLGTVSECVLCEGVTLEELFLLCGVWLGIRRVRCNAMWVATRSVRISGEELHFTHSSGT